MKATQSPRMLCSSSTRLLPNLGPRTSRTWRGFRALQRFDIREILRPPGGTFVRDQVLAPNHRKRRIAELSHHTTRPGVAKFDAIDLGENVDAARRPAHHASATDNAKSRSRKSSFTGWVHHGEELKAELPSNERSIILSDTLG
ncbi:MAG: hypothetical protein H6729_17270 [Deltaproteobacteria bacterium]|nr:hypothetical protein [Deltaproteobacteria bacterium]